jgi:hypothetical protein
MQALRRVLRFRAGSSCGRVRMAPRRAPRVADGADLLRGRHEVPEPRTLRFRLPLDFFADGGSWRANIRRRRIGWLGRLIASRRENAKAQAKGQETAESFLHRSSPATDNPGVGIRARHVSNSNGPTHLQPAAWRKRLVTNSVSAATCFCVAAVQAPGALLETFAPQYWSALMTSPRLRVPSAR